MNGFGFSNEPAMTFPHRISSVIALSVPGNDEAHGTCFICGGDSEPGAPMITVSRLWQKGEQMLDSIISLQACMACVYLASPNMARWTYKPRLTRAEKLGFRFYSESICQALDHGEKIQRSRRESVVPNACDKMPRYPLVLEVDDLLGGRLGDSPLEIISGIQCHYCFRTVDVRKPHMRIRVALETLTVPTIVTHDAMDAGWYCNQCAKELFPVDNAGFTSNVEEDMFDR